MTKQATSGAVTFDRVELACALINAQLAASDDASRPILTGASVRYDPDERQLTVAATDSYRLTRTRIRVPLDLPKPKRPGVVVDGIILGDLKDCVAALKRSKATHVQLAVDDDRYHVRDGDDVRIHAGGLIGGDYPKYEGLIPVGEHEPSGLPSFSRKFLADIGKLVHPQCGYTAAAMRSDSGGERPLKLTYIDQLKPTVWHFPDLDGDGHVNADVIYLLMPVRIP